MKCIVAILVMFLTATSGAQTRFLAYKVTGNVKYGDGKKEYPLKVGKILDSSKWVRLTNKASLMLICERSSRSFILEEGTHYLAKNSGSCTTTDYSITGKYLEYVWWQFTHPKASAEEERKKNISDPGAVSRGCPGIEFISPDTTSYYRENLVLQWKTHAVIKKKEFALYTAHNSPIPLIRIRLNKDRLVLDSFKHMLEPSTEYYWTVLLDGNETCPRKLIRTWGTEDFNLLIDNINTASLILKLDNAEKDYLRGFVMEKTNFPGEAFRFYKEAAKQAPDNKRYKTTLIRYRKLFRLS